MCPECGDAFSPVDHRFRPNTVEFCCAGCGQQYYGIDPNGLIEPREFTCVTCNAPCSLARDMVLRPAPGASEQEIQIERIPWPPDEQTSMWRAALKMLGLALGAPTRVGRALRGERPTGAVSWLVCLGIPVGIGYMVTVVVISGMFSGMLGMGSRGTTPGEMLEMVGVAGATLVGPVIVLFMAVSVFSCITWAIVRGGDRGLRFSRVFACWAFAMTPAVMAIVPCVGIYCGILPFIVWAPILAGLTLSQCCNAGSARVVAGVIAPVLAVFIAAAASLVLVFAFAAPGMAAVPPPGYTVAPDGTIVPDPQTGVDDGEAGEEAGDEAGANPRQESMP
jgi:hypothetical protein